jgi:hypothetical protein
MEFFISEAEVIGTNGVKLCVPSKTINLST